MAFLDKLRDALGMNPGDIAGKIGDTSGEIENLRQNVSNLDGRMDDVETTMRDIVGPGMTGMSNVSNDIAQAQRDSAEALQKANDALAAASGISAPTIAEIDSRIDAKTQQMQQGIDQAYNNLAERVNTIQASSGVPTESTLAPIVTRIVDGMGIVTLEDMRSEMKSNYVPRTEMGSMISDALANRPTIDDVSGMIDAKVQNIGTGENFGKRVSRLEATLTTLADKFRNIPVTLQGYIGDTRTFLQDIASLGDQLRSLSAGGLVEDLRSIAERISPDDLRDKINDQRAAGFIPDNPDIGLHGVFYTSSWVIGGDNRAWTWENLSGLRETERAAILYYNASLPDQEVIRRLGRESYEAALKNRIAEVKNNLINELTTQKTDLQRAISSVKEAIKADLDAAREHIQNSLPDGSRLSSLSQDIEDKIRDIDDKVLNPFESFNDTLLTNVSNTLSNW